MATATSPVNNARATPAPRGFEARKNQETRIVATSPAPSKKLFTIQITAEMEKLSQRRRGGIGMESYLGEVISAHFAELRSLSMANEAPPIFASEVFKTPVNLDVHRTTSPAKIAAMRRLISQGRTLSEVAERTGVKKSTVARHFPKELRDRLLVESGGDEDD
jgi:hypothetical protein